MKNKKLVTLLLFFSIITGSVFSVFAENTQTGSGVDLSKMSAAELLEFYSKNKDYGKKRIGLDYSKYVAGDWVVLRGEYKNTDGSPVPNKYIQLKIGSEKYPAVTNQEGIFNIEIKKEDINKDLEYLGELKIEHFRSFFSLKGRTLIDKSIFHFAIEKKVIGKKGEKNEGEYVLNIKNIHNPLFEEGEESFKYIETINFIPSYIGIQGFSFIILIILFLVFGYSSYFKYRIKNDDTIKEDV